jgi:hypothetical protein
MFNDKIEMEHKIPFEINDRFRIFGKDADEVDYTSVGSRADEFNFCACGGNMGLINRLIKTKTVCDLLVTGIAQY